MKTPESKQERISKAEEEIRQAAARKCSSAPNVRRTSDQNQQKERTMSSENERRADYGERALRAGSPDFGDHGLDQEGVLTEVSDTIANVMHTCDRYEVDWTEALSQGHSAYAGDHEDGPPPKSRDAGDLYPAADLDS
jgi:hypothetical protein